MGRRRAIRAACLAALGGALGCTPQPDVLLVTIDTLRADHLSTYGFPLETSPNLDAFAAGAVVFERAIAASSATTPSHASIMTSLYPRQHSVGFLNGGSLLHGDPTLAELFAAAGYRTAAFVGNLVLERRTGFDRGFGVYDDVFDRREPRRDVYERAAESTTRRALAWLSQQAGEPVFLWVHYQDPHGPYLPPAGNEGRFRVEPEPGEVPLPVVPGPGGRGGIPEYQALDGLTRPSEYRSRYADEIFYADHWLGELLAGFEARRGEPVVLVTADHGESFGENGRFMVHFWTSTPEIAHVPFVLRAEGLAPARRRELVSHVDVLPTLLELAGLEAPDEVRGVALGPVLRGERSVPERVVYCDAGRELSAYRRSGFLRVRDAAGAWDAPGGPDPPPLPDRGAFYGWKRDGRFRPLRDDVQLDPEIAGYVREARPMVRAPALDAEERARLRALGYADDATGSPPAAPTGSTRAR